MEEDGRGHAFQLDRPDRLERDAVRCDAIHDLLGHEHLTRRRRDGIGTGPSAPLVTGPDGRPVGRSEVARARRRSNAIIRAGSNLNVELCRKTGEFFREWGEPGSRFPSPQPAWTPSGSSPRRA